MSVGRENNCQDKTLLMFEMCLQELLYSLYLDERAMQIQIEKKMYENLLYQNICYVPSCHSTVCSKKSKEVLKRMGCQIIGHPD